MSQIKIPDGFVLMPKELTDNMVNGLYFGGYSWGDEDSTRDYFQNAYEIMISRLNEGDD